MTALNRRHFVQGLAAAGGAGLILPAYAQTAELNGTEFDLTLSELPVNITGRRRIATVVNNAMPGPLLRLRESTDVTIRVHNRLPETSSIHWHGVKLPNAMDGVPGLTFAGIPPGETFTYRFPVSQSGTYWYHSHSGMQEQTGLFGSIIMEPQKPDPFSYDREYVVHLSDWTDEDPMTIVANLKQQGDYYNYHRRTLGDFVKDAGQEGFSAAVQDRLMWGGMRMSPTDIMDVTGSIYTFLVNGHSPAANWTAAFQPGERVRLRFINSAAMTTFDVRIPGLALTIVQADGTNVEPVEVEEFRIGVAETYDVIVTPAEDKAFTIVGEAIDRSGMARATLAPRAGMSAEVPALRKRPLATMTDMGMDMGMPDAAPRGIDPSAEQNPSVELGNAAAMPMQMDHSAMAGMDHSQMAGMNHGAGGHEMSMNMRDFANAPQVKRDPGVQTISPMPMDRTGEPGQGLSDVGHRVLVYRDLVALTRNPDVRAPSRSIDIHLTGNMERFMWSFDGAKMSDAHEPLPFTQGERVRINLINDTMMGHPIHIHGHFFELVTGHGDHAPRKHTVLVQPGGKVTWDFTADAVGDWAFHCHLLYHMHAGMMRVVSVRPRKDAA